jgi:hypothetical protein
MNTINIISPYRHNGTWVFDDAQHGLVREPFISGADILIDRAVIDIPNAAEGFKRRVEASRIHTYRWLCLRTRKAPATATRFSTCTNKLKSHSPIRCSIRRCRWRVDAPQEPPTGMLCFLIMGKTVTKGKGLGLRAAEKHRSIYVLVCSGIDHIATDPHTSREQRLRELWMIMHRCQNMIGDYLAEAVCGEKIPPRTRKR